MNIKMMLIVLFASFSVISLCAESAEISQKPAILFNTKPSFEIATKLHQAGFEINAIYNFDDHPLTLEKIKSYNILVVIGLGASNADFSLSEANRQNIDVLNQFMQSGGGILYLPSWCQQKTQIPPQEAFLKPLGITPLFEELTLDPKTTDTATAWKINFAHSNNIIESSITKDVKSLWYPVPQRIGAQDHLIPLKADDNWKIVVKGESSSFTNFVSLENTYATQGTQGSYQSEVPLVAIRQVGKGRLVYLGIANEYIFGANAGNTLEGIVMERGLKQIPSDGYKLIENSLRWLSESSITEKTLGGAKTDSTILENPWKTKFGKPYVWTEQLAFPAVKPAYPGVIGPRTTYSSGKANPSEWVKKAKSKGLSYIIFLEDFRNLTKDGFEKLKKECQELSTPDFAAIPGFTIDDEIGNHYFYFGTTFPYPEDRFISAKDRVFISYDAEISQSNPYIKGQLSMTSLMYAYTVSGFKLTAGNYLFSQDAVPFANFFSNWTATGVISVKDGKVLEDATSDYLKLVDFGQGPLPLVIDLIDDPEQIGKSGWLTVLRLPENGGSVVAGHLNEKTKLQDYWNFWHFYPDNPSKIYVTSGPEIESWCYTGPRDYAGDTEGDFVWQNYRWVVLGKVKSDVGLKEVTIFDGEEIFRHFLIQGQKEFEFALDLNHDKQHNLVLIVTDIQGKKAISGEQWDRNHRLEEFNCADRNNQLSYGYLTRQDGLALMLGGNQVLSSPNKRLDPREISPSGTFKNDALLGAPAFDGSAGGEPSVFATPTIKTLQGAIQPPNVSESKRLLHSMDVHIGEGLWEHYFADDVGVYNVWHTLWKTVPAKDFIARKRNYFFQVNPNNPLAVFLWQIELKLKRDVQNQGLDIGFLRSSKDRIWSLRSEDGAVYSGNWEETQKSNTRTFAVPFGKGSYSALLDSPLGGAAVFSMTDGLMASLTLPQKSNVFFTFPANDSFQKQDSLTKVDLLLLGIPRITSFSANLPSSSTEVVERFMRDFGLDDGYPNYKLEIKSGELISQRYILDIDGKEKSCFSGKISGNLISSLPIAVSNLNNNWSAYLYNGKLKKVRPIGVFENKAWTTIIPTEDLNLFVGHPITADNSDIMIQFTQIGENSWQLEIHNPTDKPIKTEIRINPDFDPLKENSFKQEIMEIKAGSSIWKKL